MENSVFSKVSVNWLNFEFNSWSSLSIENHWALLSILVSLWSLTVNVLASVAFKILSNHIAKFYKNCVNGSSSIAFIKANSEIHTIYIYFFYSNCYSKYANIICNYSMFVKNVLKKCLYISVHKDIYKPNIINTTGKDDCIGFWTKGHMIQNIHGLWHGNVFNRNALWHSPWFTSSIGLEHYVSEP